MSNHKNQTSALVEKVEKLLPKEGSGKVSLSLIVPVYNCSEAIGETLESVKRQQYSPLEVIVVDASSTDHTVEIVHSYSDLISRVYTVTDYNVADMINRGISLASGDYIAFLYPGTTYISPYTFQTFAEQVQARGRPDLIYCGSIQREIKQDPHTVLGPFDIQLLRKGRAFAATPACWLRSDLFEKVGKFNPHYTVRSSFDLFCRIAQEKELKTAMIDRIFVDFDYGRFSYGKLFRFAAETWSILVHHFGLRAALGWFATLNPSLFLRWFWHRAQLHLSKK